MKSVELSTVRQQADAGEEGNIEEDTTRNNYHSF